MKKSIMPSKRPKLTSGQKELFLLICEKIKNGTKLTIDETKKIYIKNVCKTFIDGEPAKYNYYYKAVEFNEKGQIVRWEGKTEKVDKTYLDFIIVQWLTHNIGSLVLKGYLQVLPIIEFK